MEFFFLLFLGDIDTEIMKRMHDMKESDTANATMKIRVKMIYCR